MLALYNAKSFVYVHHVFACCYTRDVSPIHMLSPIKLQLHLLLHLSGKHRTRYRLPHVENTLRLPRCALKTYVHALQFVKSLSHSIRLHVH